LDGQPLLIFFSPRELQQAFGGEAGVREAFEEVLPTPEEFKEKGPPPSGGQERVSRCRKEKLKAA
jgi:hypothetical protein